jgi:hypothetical protein
LNLRPLDPQSKGAHLEPTPDKGVTLPESSVCTPVCTSDTENAHGNPAAGGGELPTIGGQDRQGGQLEALAAALMGLSFDDRATLAAMLLKANQP